MKINVSENQLANDPAAARLIEICSTQNESLGLENAAIYYGFPIYRNLVGELVSSKIVIVSPKHGVFAIETSDITRVAHFNEEASRTSAELRLSFRELYSRLQKNERLLENMFDLAFPVKPVVFMPWLETPPSHSIDHSQIEYVLSENQLSELFEKTILPRPIRPEVFTELISTIEGAKGLVRQKLRNVENQSATSKGTLVNKLEAEIASFDMRQLRAATAPVNGPERIRGLAGSGKTVVLAMKAALAHLTNEDATILYTFHTKSLYQHIKRMITRFYRQFDDRDPDWSRVIVMHAWGGRSEDGVYFNACSDHNVEPLSFRDASLKSPNDPFGYACSKLIHTAKIEPSYDYIFVDEAQDFPNSFLTLCVQLAHQNRMICAYDELQTIFRPQATHPSQYLPKGMELSEDLVLYKCYRNPREILVSAHALGFGIYGSRIVQMLENREHWEDVGYEVVLGNFTEGSETIIERPEENSLTSISASSSRYEIVKPVSFGSFHNEIDFVVEGIKADIAEGLNPEDILVITVDDRNARRYLDTIGKELATVEIRSNNIHTDSFNTRDFQREGAVTLSTVHKAKGNEAYMVYIVGCDALLLQHASVRQRNMIFTAMTRAKGWVRLSGIDTLGAPWISEIMLALENYPYLKFQYPSEEQLNVMKRDLDEVAARKQEGERKLDEVLSVLSQEEIESLLAQRRIKKGRK